MNNISDTNLKVGELLLEEGVISKEQLEIALEEHQKRHKRLGEVLVELNYVTSSELVDILAQQLGYDRYNLNHTFEVDISEVVPLDMAKKLKLIPLRRMEGQKLQVVITDPMNFQGIDTVESTTGLIVQPLLCTGEEFDQLAGTIYGTTHEMPIGDLDTSSPEFGVDEPAFAEMQELELTAVQSMTEEAPVVHTVNWLLTEAINRQASDIHISPEKNHIQLRFRIDGQLIEEPPPPKAMFLAIVSRIKVISKLDIAHTLIPQDGRFTVKIKGKEVNIRVSTIPTVHGENMVLRILDSSTGLKQIDQLGMTKVAQDMLERAILNPYGMILATGPTGSGKSTSLYSIIMKVSRPELNIITVEDPAEFRVQGIRQVQLNEKVGMTFSSALRSILRQDPDVVMVGEIRDSETAAIAIRAALTGHLVLSTLHTNNAVSSIERLKDMGVPAFMIAATLTACIAQRLVRKVCDSCKEARDKFDPAEAKEALQLPDGITYYEAKGCRECRNTGYKGRTGIYELLDLTNEIKSLISKSSTSQEIEQRAIETGALVTFKVAAAEKIITGETTVEEVLSVLML